MDYERENLLVQLFGLMRNDRRMLWSRIERTRDMGPGSKFKAYIENHLADEHTRLHVAEHDGFVSRAMQQGTGLRVLMLPVSEYGNGIPSSSAKVASPLRVAAPKYFLEIYLRSHVAYGKFAKGLDRDCASLLVVGEWCKLCESDSAYLRILPSPSPARGVKNYLVQTWKTWMIFRILYSGLKDKALTIKGSCSVPS